MHDETLSRTSSSLLQRARERDQDAWVKLVSLYAPLVMRWCRRWSLSSADAENVCQEVFLAVSRSLDGFRHDSPGSTFRGWLWTICRGKAVDLLSAQAQDKVGEGGSDARRRLEAIPGPPHPRDDVEAPETLSEERSLLLRQAISLIQTEFSERDWNIFHGLIVDGQEPQALAVQFDVSRNAVYLVKSRVLKRLRGEFSGLIDDLDSVADA